MFGARFTSGNPIKALANLFKRDVEPTDWASTDRLSAYAAWSLYYDNAIYTRLTDGGLRDQINATLGNLAAADLAGMYNPVARAVNLYQHVFGGEFGVDIQTVPDAKATAIQEPLERIWRWSNINVQKQLLCRFAPLYGNVGLRIVGRNDPDPARRRVYIKAEHPGVVQDVEQDDRGNVTSILLEYDYTIGIGTAQQTLVIRELQTKERFQTWRLDGTLAIPYDLINETDGGPWAEYDNALGFVPYVLLSHTPTGGPWGHNCFYRVVRSLDSLNALLTHLDVQIHDHVRVLWLIAASGPAPSEIDLSGRKVAYVDTSANPDGAAPVMQPLVAPLNLADAIERTSQQIALIEDELPELKATGGRFISGQSGETIAELRKPAADLIATARVNYEDGLIRAQMQALSVGILYDLWDLGTGTGSREAADRAYSGGFEDHRLNNRPLFADYGAASQQLTRIQDQQRQALAMADTIPEVEQ
jgi:hypothetical protein